MIYTFESFELDIDKVELRKGRTVLAVEPQVFSLLRLLVENRERVVSKDEIVEKVWGGRFVSDAAVTSRIKSARRALADEGKVRRFIRTVHGIGFRFVAEATATGTPTVAPIPQSHPSGVGAEAPVPAATVKPSIAVLPFRLIGVAGPHATIADALPHDLISEMARLRWLFVIARGSSFRFRSDDPDIHRVGEALGVRYCLSGAVEIAGTAMAITVELADTRDGGVVWGERYTATVARVFEIRAEIVASVVAALEIQIPLNESRLARLSAPDSLDAWSLYHLGLQHMFRFSRADNAAATNLFQQAVAQDPGFARAHAGLSFTHFQTAFLRYEHDVRAASALARRFAERGIELDPMDPFANLTMGRAFWLDGDLDGSLVWLDRAMTLSPNYAQGIYARAWADTVSARGTEGQTNADLAMSLSPLDPLLYAMLATRALSHLVRGDDAEAARWAEKAARAPGAHVLIGMIAVIAHTLNGDSDRAAAWAADVRKRATDLTQADFFRSFPFQDGQDRRRISRALGQYGL